MIHKLIVKARQHLPITIGAALILAFMVFQGMYDWHVHQVNNQTLSSQPIIASLIDNSVNNLNTVAPVDAQTGQVYFPDVRLQLPAPNQNYALRQIEYANVGDGTTFGLQVTSRGIMSEAQNKLLTAQANAESAHKDSQDVLVAIFRQVPNLQACSRGVQLSYSPRNENGESAELQFTKKLSSGKTLYAYTETTCTSQQLPTLVDYLRQVQSY